MWQKEMWGGWCLNLDLVGLLRIGIQRKAVRFCQRAWSIPGKGLVYASGQSFQLLCRERMIGGQVGDQ